MLRRVVRVGVRLLVGVVLGAAAGALYAGLVGAVHRGAYGRWDRIPTFAVLCVLAGALFGLLRGLGWVLWGGAAQGKGSGQSPAGGSGHPGSADRRLPHPGQRQSHRQTTQIKRSHASLDTWIANGRISIPALLDLPETDSRTR
jgi:hypothetical protein